MLTGGGGTRPGCGSLASPTHGRPPRSPPGGSPAALKLLRLKAQLAARHHSAADAGEGQEPQQQEASPRIGSLWVEG